MLRHYEHILSIHGLYTQRGYSSCTTISLRLWTYGISSEAIHKKAEQSCKTRDGKKSPTYSVCLTFSTQQIPESNKLGYRNYPVEKHAPHPLRCFLCQRFGHVAGACRHHCSRRRKEYLTIACTLLSTDTTQSAYGGYPSHKRQVWIITLSVNTGISRKYASAKIQTASATRRNV